MATLTLTRNDRWSTVTVDWSAATGTVTVLRSDRNGQVTVTTSTDAAGTVTDKTPAIGGPVVYTLTDGNGETSETITFPADGLPILSLANGDSPAHIDHVSGYNHTRTSGSTAHYVPGRRDPVLVLREFRTRAGTFSLIVKGFPRAVYLESILGGSTGRICLLRVQEHDGLDLYFTTLSTTITPAAEGGMYWALTVTFVETLASSLGAASSTFQDVADVHTFDELAHGDA